MKVIDAHTGRTVIEGDVLPVPGGGGSYTIVKIIPGIWSAKILVRSNNGGFNGWFPLSVRWTHPGFPLQHVAFIPS